MKLRNKKTGDIRELTDVIIDNLKKNGSTLNAINIDEIRNVWEDYEDEPKYYYFIAGRGDVEGALDRGDMYDIKHKDMGNYFETKEEAEKAVEKLKAWKRLKDNKLEFVKWDGRKINDGCIQLAVAGTLEYGECESDWQVIKRDLDLLFGGEE